MRYDVVIIGGGLGGLECGLILARRGRSVLVLEQGTQPGGCMQSYRRHGMTFDTGFHYVGGLDEGQSLHEAFDYLGLLKLPWQRLDADGFDRILIGGRSFAFAEGYDNFALRLAEQFPSQRRALYRYTDLLRQASDVSFSPSLTAGSDDSHRTWMETGAWSYLQSQFSDPLLINVLSGTSLKMELRRESLPLFSFLHGNSSYIESSWRLKGDSSAIVRKLVEGIRAQGGEVMCNARVVELSERCGRIVQARCANGECYGGSLFISDIHPSSTCRLVKMSSRMKPVYRTRILQLENSFGMFTVSLRIRPQQLRYFNHNLYIYLRPDVWDLHRNPADGGVEGVLVSCKVPEDGSEYTRQVDLLTPMQWETCRPWSLTRSGRRDNRYNDLKKRMAEECIRLAEQALPGLREVSHAYTSTPLTWRDYTLTPEGSAYGVRKDYRNPLLTMLSPRTPIPNLLLTGQSLTMHGLHGVTMTALRTCNEALKN